MGAGMVAFLESTLKSGIHTLLDLVDFETLLQGADIFFTGERKIDHQSIDGKAVSGIGLRAKEKGVSVVAIVGDMEEGLEGAEEIGIEAIFSINHQAKNFEEIRHNSEQALAIEMDKLLKFYQIARRI